jgi:hypothetical protein
MRGRAVTAARATFPIRNRVRVKRAKTVFAAVGTTFGALRAEAK